MLSEQEAEEIKQEIIQQIESTFSAEKIPLAVQQIEAMSPKELEEFLEKNKMIKEDNPNENPECVFCSIASGKIKSVKIGENESAIAVLEINPISRGHAIIIPKNHESKDEKGVLTLAENISKLLKEKLKPKEVKTSKSKLFRHEIINILPIYDNEDFNSERKKSSMEENEIIKEEIEKKEEKPIEKPLVEKIKEILWLPKRIP